MSNTPKREPLEVLFNVDERWFSEKLAENMMSKRKLAIAMNLEPSAISRMLQGKRRMTAPEAAEIARHIMTPVAEVMRRAGIEVGATSESSVPLQGWIDSEGNINLNDGSRSIATPSTSDNRVVALRAQTRGRFDGWVLFYRGIDIPDGVTADAVGQLCVVKIMGESESKIRWVTRGYDPGLWTLESFIGPPKIEQARLKFAVPVLWTKQM